MWCYCVCECVCVLMLVKVYQSYKRNNNYTAGGATGNRAKFALENKLAERNVLAKGLLLLFQLLHSPLHLRLPSSLL